MGEIRNEKASIDDALDSAPLHPCRFRHGPKQQHGSDKSPEAFNGALSGRHGSDQRLPQVPPQTGRRSTAFGSLALAGAESLVFWEGNIEPIWEKRH